MRIAIVNSSYYPDEPSGAERSLRYLAEAAVARGHVCTVFTTGDRRQRTHVNGVGVERFNFGPQPVDAASQTSGMLSQLLETYSSATANEMASVIEKFTPDVVHTNNLAGISVALWVRLRNRGMPIVHTLRDYYLMCPNTAHFRAGKPCPRTCGACRAMSLPRLMATRHVKTVIANSRFILEKHIGAGAFGRALREVIYSAYRPGKAVNPRRKVGTQRPLVIGYLGVLAPEKGVDRLIAAFDSISKASSRSMILSIAGSGEREHVSKLKAQARDMPVRFIGESTPQAFYDAVDLTVVPSLWDEPLAPVIFESFAHGVPVLASSKGGSRELILPRKTGWLFDPDSPTDLETKLGAAVEECGETLYEQLSAGCVTDAQRFLPERVLDDYVAVLQTTALF